MLIGFKDETTNELYGAFGYLTELNLQKNKMTLFTP